MAAIILIEINNFLLIFAAELQKFAGILISLGQNFDNFFPRTFFSIVDATMSPNSKHNKMFSKMSAERKTGITNMIIFLFLVIFRPRFSVFIFRNILTFIDAQHS